MAFLDHFILNENAYFYKAQDGFVLSTNRINTIFAQVSSDRVGNFTFKRVKQAEALGTVSVYYSICVFKFNKRPSFLDDDFNDIFETKYGYLMIVEYLDYIVIIRRYITELDLIKELEPLDYLTISRVYVGNETKFERLSMKNMNVAQAALRNKTLEANDVKESISSLGANKYIVNNMRVRDSESTKSLSFGTSRISELDTKVKLTPLLRWIVGVVNRTRAFANTPSFLDVFAQPVSFEKYSDQLMPNSVLFSVSEIKSDIENGIVEEVSYSSPLGDQVVIPMNRFMKQVDKFNGFCELDVAPNENQYMIKNSLDNTLLLRVNPKSITISSDKLKRIELTISGDKITLLQYLVQRNLYLVTFEAVEFVYFSRKLFKDHKLISGIDHFLSTFIANDALLTTTSEKGTILPGSTSFQANSIFGVIENTLAGHANFLFCDDYGNEWADYISIDDDSINFYHAKSNGSTAHSLSASAFHEIVSQALKNLGNVIPSENQWGNKQQKWTEMYSGSQIRRLRIGDTVEHGITMYKDLVFKPNVRKKVYLVVDFISKAQLTTAFHEIRAGNPVGRKKELTQILWLISSLISNCAELGYDVHIICQP